MKIFASMFLTLFALQAFASPVGVYYSPREETDDGGYSPEKLTEVTSNAFKVELVFNGAKIVETVAVRIQGDKIIARVKPTPEAVWDCQGEQVTFEAITESGEFAIPYKVNSEGLTLDVPEGGVQTLARANVAQIARIRNLPTCALK